MDTQNDGSENISHINSMGTYLLYINVLLYTSLASLTVVSKSHLKNTYKSLKLLNYQGDVQTITL